MVAGHKLAIIRLKGSPSDQGFRLTTNNYCEREYLIPLPFAFSKPICLDQFLIQQHWPTPYFSISYSRTLPKSFDRHHTFLSSLKPNICSMTDLWQFSIGLRPFSKPVPHSKKSLFILTIGTPGIPPRFIGFPRFHQSIRFHLISLRQPSARYSFPLLLPRLLQLDESVPTIIFEERSTLEHRPYMQAGTLFRRILIKALQWRASLVHGHSP